MKEKYFKYVKNHYKNSFENKTCFLIGGTGGTGKAIQKERRKLHRESSNRQFRRERHVL